MPPILWFASTLVETARLEARVISRSVLDIKPDFSAKEGRIVSGPVRTRVSRVTY